MKTMDVKLKAGDFEGLKKNLKNELEKGGFSILSEYDFRKILNSKGKKCDRNVYVVEACEAGRASEVLDVDPGMGSILPCRISLIEKEDGYHMSYLDPASIDISNPRASKIMSEIGALMSKIGNYL